MIISKRIRLRTIEKEDLPRFVTWLNDPEVCRNLQMYQPFRTAQEEEWFKGILPRPLEEQPLMNEIKTAESWQPVGNEGFFDISQGDRPAEIGIFISEKSFLSQSYGSEAIGGCLTTALRM